MKPLGEWEKRAIGEEGLTRPVANRLLAVARASRLGGPDGTRVLVDAGRFVRAQNVVGVIAAGEHALEILPKIDIGEQPQVSRERLVHMLSTIHDLEIAAGSATALDIQRHTLLEVLIRLFADRLIDCIRRGLPRRYVEEQRDLPTLRGRLNVVRQFSALAANPAQLACRYDTLSPDVLLNRFMKATVQRLRRLARRPETQRRLAELAFAYADIGDFSSRDMPWSALHLDRTDRQWGPLLRLAKLILRGDYQTTSSGQVTGTALLFDMGRLFEAYVAKMLQRVLRENAVEVVVQGGLKHCLAEINIGGQSGSGRFQTRPDILLQCGSNVLMVIDTKWKRLLTRAEEVKRGVSQRDVYQVMAYARLYASPKLMLLYPYHSSLETPGVLEQYAVARGAERLFITTIDLSVPHLTGARLRALVMGAIVQGEPSMAEATSLEVP